MFLPVVLALLKKIYNNQCYTKGPVPINQKPDYYWKIETKYSLEVLK